jgi:hypothetical protein
VGLLVCLVLIFEYDCSRGIDAVAAGGYVDNILGVKLTRIRTESTELIKSCSRHVFVSSVIKQSRKSNCSRKFVDSNSGSSISEAFHARHLPWVNKEF